VAVRVARAIVMTFVRSAVFNLVFFGFTTLMAFPATLIRWFAPHRLRAFIQTWAGVLVGSLRVICGVRVVVTGWEHVPSGAALIVSHHESAFDTLIWLLLLPGCRYVLKRELLRIPLVGSLITALGMIAVDRSGGAAAMRVLMREGQRVAGEGGQMVIFPEGTRAPAGTVLPLQPGFLALAARTHLPIVPVRTDSGRCWARRGFWKYPGTIRIDIRPPLAPDLPRADIMRRLHDEFAAGPGG